MRSAPFSVFDLRREDGFDVESNRAGCYLIVSSVGEWQARLSSLGDPVTPLRGEGYGMSEFALNRPERQSHSVRTIDHRRFIVQCSSSPPRP